MAARLKAARLKALGHHQPSRVLTNAELTEMVDTDEEWILRRVGIKTRHIAGPDESVADMATEAGAKALANAGLDADDIDMVLVATTTAKERSPNNAARVAAALGVGSPATIDINTFCSGFTHAVALADQAVAVGSASRALVIGADKFSDFTDWSDRRTCILLGDGAGAAVVEASDESGISPVVWGSDPEMGRAVRLEPPDYLFDQDGQAVYRWATTNMADVARRICETAGVAAEDLAGVVLHQANLRIIERIVDRLGAVNAVVARDVIDSGNTSAASVPLAFSKLVERREIPAGAPVLLFGFGGGLAYAGQIVACP
ncbi:MAG: beta-ketoacyl-ACP synthase III [Acidimicrobiales bacterium]